MMTKIGIFLCLASAMSVVEAFSLFTPATTSTRTVTHLFMNKKKAQKKPANSKGFGSVLGLTNSFQYAGSIQPGKQSPQRVVVDEQIVMPDFAKDGIPKKGSASPLLPWIIEVKTPKEIEKMRAAGKLARDILDLAGRAVAVGVTTDEIDTLVYEAIIEVGRTEEEWSLSEQVFTFGNCVLTNATFHLSQYCTVHV
jgi:Xaa-Pro aminopeptidase